MTYLTRRHYNALAAALADAAPPSDERKAHFQWQEDVSAITNALAALNGNFRRDLFLAASGYITAQSARRT